MRLPSPEAELFSELMRSLGGSWQTAMLAVFAPVVGVALLRLAKAILSALIYKAIMWLAQRLGPGAGVFYIAEQLNLEPEKVKEFLEWSPELKERLEKLEDRVAKLEQILEELREKLVTGGGNK